MTDDVEKYLAEIEARYPFAVTQGGHRTPAIDIYDLIAIARRLIPLIPHEQGLKSPYTGGWRVLPCESLAQQTTISIDNPCTCDRDARIHAAFFGEKT